MFGMKDFSSLLSDDSMKFSFDEIKQFFDGHFSDINEDLLDIIIKYLSLSLDDREWFINNLNYLNENF